MRFALQPGKSNPRSRYFRSSHVWLLIFLLLSATLLALCGRSAAAAAEDGRVEEAIAKAMALEPDAVEGAKLYRRHCMSCHGRQALGNAKTVTPALAGQVAPYLVKQLVDLAEGYRELPEMHREIARAELSTLQAVRDMASYLSTLPPMTEPELGDGTRLVLGGRIYKTVCADCHGTQGVGDEAERIPALRGQHYSYLLRQSRQVASGHRYSVNITVMVLLEALTLEQLTAVSDYISRLPGSAEAESVADARLR